jgi:hypothetical protein
VARLARDNRAMTLDFSVVAAGRWDEAQAALVARYGDDLEQIGEWWEACGDALHSAEAYRRAHAAFGQFASWATSGAEGMGRMVDVNRVAAKLEEFSEP